MLDAPSLIFEISENKELNDSLSGMAGNTRKPLKIRALLCLSKHLNKSLERKVSKIPLGVHRYVEPMTIYSSNISSWYWLRPLSLLYTLYLLI